MEWFLVLISAEKWCRILNIGAAGTLFTERRSLFW